MNHVLAAFFNQLDVLLGVRIVKRFAGNNFRAAAMHLQGTDCCGEDGDMRLKTRVAALDVPEFLETDVCGKAGFGDIVVKEFEGDTIGDNRRLSDRDVCKWSCVYQTRIVLGGTHQGWVDGISHEGGHGIADFQVADR